MNFTEAIRSGFENYANFSGRAQRSAYWYWALFIVLVTLALNVLDTTFFSEFTELEDLANYAPGPLASLWSIAVLIPNLALAVRRLHDRDKSGWFVLLMFIPIVNFYILYLFVTSGTDGPNRFGEDPLGGSGKGSVSVLEKEGDGYSKSNIPPVDPDN